MFRQGSLKVELEDAQVTTDVFFLLDTCVVLFGHGTRTDRWFYNVF